MLKFLILGLALLSLTEAWKTYRGYRTYKVIPENEAQLIELRNIFNNDIELDVWKESRGVGHEAHVMVPPQKRLQFAELLLTQGFSLDIHVADVGDKVAESKTRLDARRSPDGRLNWDLQDWNTVQDTYAEMANWAAACPADLNCTWESIGDSYNQQPINAFTISTGGDKETIYIDSLTHSREWLAGSTVNNIMNEILTNYATDSDIANFLTKYNFVFVPIVNPDGYDYTFTNDRLWRKNVQPNPGSGCGGTDLNRNFNVVVDGEEKWCTFGGNPAPCSTTFCGYLAASAPETRAIQDYISLLNNKKILISIHAYANMWLQPFGHADDNLECSRSNTHAEMLFAGEAAITAIESVGGQQWTAGSVCETIYVAPGGTVDFAHGNAGFPYSYTPELRGTDFEVPTTEIQPAFEETWAGIKALIAATE